MALHFILSSRGALRRDTAFADDQICTKENCGNLFRRMLLRSSPRSIHVRRADRSETPPERSGGSRERDGLVSEASKAEYDEFAGLPAV